MSYAPQWVKDRARERKGTAGMKREMAGLRRTKANKAHGVAMDDYKSLSGRDPTDDFNEWVGCKHWHEWSSLGLSDKFAPWVKERVQELQHGDDWKAGG